MIFLWSGTHLEEEEEEEEGDLNDALLDELVDEVEDEEDLLEGVEPVAAVAVVEDLDAEEGEDETARAFFEGEDEDSAEDGDLDYDSFDDKDDL